MNPATLNLILVAIVLLFVLNGFFQGLIHMIGSIVGLLVGVMAASRFDAALGGWIAGATGWSLNICTIIAFVVILLVFTRVFGLVLHLLEKTFGFMKIPLVGLANRLAGGVLGFFEGVLVVGLTLIIIKTLPFPNFSLTITQSGLAASLMAAATLLLPLLPKQIRDLYSA
jgi:uncharacterized membrane protein required for colicin V production